MWTHGTDDTMEQYGLDKTVHFVRAVPFGWNGLVKPVRLSENGKCGVDRRQVPQDTNSISNTKNKLNCDRPIHLPQVVKNNVPSYLQPTLHQTVPMEGRRNTVQVTIAWVTTIVTTMCSQILLKSLSEI